MDCSTPGFAVHHQLPEPTQTHVHWVGDAIQPSHSLSSPLLLPSVFPRIRVFSNESLLRIKWSKYWSFSFSISPSNEYSGLISFRIDWLELLTVQGTLKTLLQHHNSKASVLWCSLFFPSYFNLSSFGVSVEKQMPDALSGDLWHTMNRQDWLYGPGKGNSRGLGQTGEGRRFWLFWCK